jgi:PIN domain nuclease of toxin-antitoxin system
MTLLLDTHVFLWWITNGVAALPRHHTDPFDRLLVAQAILEKIPLLSADMHLRAYPVQVLW